MDGIARRVGAALNQSATGVRALHGGCIAPVYRVDLRDGRAVVAKVAPPGEGRLGVEAYMLRYLAERSALPVPAVLHAEDTLLVMEYIPGASAFDRRAEEHAAELLAALHDVRGPRFGLERDTLIGGLHQPNAESGSWLAFFRERRLRYMAGEAARAGRLPASLRARVERLADRLDRWLVEPPYPSLIHGDVWTTNVLADGGRITGFLDPAIYHADPEIELAFTTLFNTFGQAFFARYHALRPIAPGFFELRRDLYNLYPLLTHVRLFGGGYVASVERIVARLGF